MALRAEASQSEGQKNDVGQVHTTNCKVATHSQNQAPLPESEDLRELPKVGAV